MILVIKMTTQTLSLPPNPESGPQNPLIQTGGLSLAVGPEAITGFIDLSDRRHETDENASSVASDLYFAKRDILSNPQLWGLFGASVTDTEAELTVKVASTTVLNELREPLISKTGIHSGKFVDHEGGYIDELVFAEYLAKREIPMATGKNDVYYVSHDNLTHRFGYQVMCEAIFGRLVTSAQKAVETKDASLAAEVFSLADDLSGRGLYLGTGGYDGRIFLSQSYRAIMSPVTAGVLAFHDGWSQIATVSKLKKLAGAKPVGQNTD